MFAKMIERLVATWACPNCTRMHRRAQAAESEASAAPRRFEGAIRQATRRMCNYRRVYILWRRRSRVLVRLLKERGVSDDAIWGAVRAAEARVLQSSTTTESK